MPEQDVRRPTIHESLELPSSIGLENFLREIATLSGPETGFRAFSHKPLEDSRSWVRLLTILPGQGTSRLEGLLENVPLQTKGSIHYEALSYYWGRSSSLEDICYLYIEQRPLPVCTNVYDAMMQLRTKDKPRILWIDAVCINQIDLDERSQQVEQMHLIYTLADRTVVWLGKSDATSEVALDFLQNYNHDTSYGNDTAWEALIVLLSRDWFSRLWCLQEIVVSPTDPVFMCGDKSFTWSMLTKTKERSLRTSDAISQIRHKRNVGRRLETFSNVRNRYQEGGSRPSIWSLVANSYGLRCTNARDKIYAILGLAAETDRTATVPDYRKSVLDVYREFMRYSLQNGETNALVFNTNLGTSITTDIDPVNYWPSWVSDWRHHKREPALIRKGSDKYNAGSSISRARVSAGPETYLLSIDVLFICTIHAVSVAVPQPAHIGRVPRIIEILEEMVIDHLHAIQKGAEPHLDDPEIREQVVKKLTPDPRVSDTFWRTLIGDVYAGSSTWQIEDTTFPAPDHVVPVYEVLRYQGANRGSRGEVEGSQSPHPQHDEAARPTPTRRSTIPDDHHAGEADADRWRSYVGNFIDSMDVLWGRQFFFTDTSTMGFGGGFGGLRDIQDDDRVALVRGCRFPLVLRRCYPDGRYAGQTPLWYRIVSEAYVHGFMRGGVFELLDAVAAGLGGQQETTVLLV